MKKRDTVRHYELQFGKAIPRRLFDVPQKVVIPAPLSCFRPNPGGRRDHHRFQVGESCKDCVGCLRDMTCRECDKCGILQEDDPKRFVYFVPLEEVANGLLEAREDVTKRRERKYYCETCSRLVVPLDPDFPGCMATMPFLNQVCDLNAKSLPPEWAVGRKIFRNSLVYDDREDTQGGQHHNLWNAVLGVPRRLVCPETGKETKVHLKDPMIPFGTYREGDLDLTDSD